MSEILEKKIDVFLNTETEWISRHVHDQNALPGHNDVKLRLAEFSKVMEHADFNPNKFHAKIEKFIAALLEQLCSDNDCDVKEFIAEYSTQIESLLKMKNEERIFERKKLLEDNICSMRDMYEKRNTGKC